MAGMMTSPRLLAAAALALMLAWPGHARAGWFVRNDQIAYRLAREGHNRQALKYWDHSADGYYGRGTALMHLGRMQEAEQALREALALAPHKTGFSDRMTMPVNRRPHFMASTWYNLGNVLYAEGELMGARDAWLKTLSFEPDHAKARHNLQIVDRLLNARERQAQAAPSGLAGSTKHKPDHGGKHGASPPQTPQPPQHTHATLHLPGNAGKVSVSSGSGRKKAGGKHRRAGAGAPPHSAQHRPSSHMSPVTGHGALGAVGDNRGRESAGSGMTRREAIQQLRLVEEGVSVFLRHRLGEKGHGASGNGGKPW